MPFARFSRAKSVKCLHIYVEIAAAKAWAHLGLVVQFAGRQLSGGPLC
jgi:hypothetical protein